jgi:hypothetical protein
MGMFRKKPVVIEAVLYSEADPADAVSFLIRGGADFVMDADEGLTIRTLEGDHHASDGDWIIKGVKGEFYPCKPDIFAATYEPAGDA